jgi:Putative Flp pilus-assembly TadE/G-like
MSDVVRRFRRDEGGIAVLFVIVAGVMLLFTAFVVDVANWFEHRRHLQVQVDAGALAAGQEFTGCFQDPATTNKKVAGTAHQYAGDPDFSTYWTTLFSSPPTTPVLPVPPGPYNRQVDKPSRVALALNSATYPLGSTDFSTDLRPDLTGVQSTPCDSLILDVKAKDVGIPSFFAKVIPDSVNPIDVHAKARVEIRQVEALSGFLPWAIPEVDPKHVAVAFINEANGNLIRVFELTNPPGGVTVLNGTPVDLWQGSQPDVDMAKHTGMIVITSRLGSLPTDPTFSVGGTLAQICTQAKTACYLGNTTTSASSMLFIRGNNTATGGTVDAPLLGNVTLTPGNCTENSAPYFLVEANCNVGVEATVDFGSACLPDPSASPCNASVHAIGPGCGGSTNLTFSAGKWSAVCGNPRIAPKSGQNPIRIGWSSNPTGPDSFSGTFPDDPAGRVYAKDDNGGPIEYVSVTPNPAPSTSPQPISVSVGVPPSLQVSNKLDPSVLLRFKERNGPDTQQIDCDASPRGPDEEIGTGCMTTYGIDEDGICPPEYDEGNELPPSTFKPTPIPTCAAVRPGSVQSMVDGLAYRFENPAQPYGSCPPNNWPDNANEDVPGPEDPRWQILIVTDFSAFKAPPGQDPVVPVLKWAGFYVTGWDLSSKTNGCADDPTTAKDDGNDPHPLGYGSNQDNGDVWGHFVNYVPFLPGATASEHFCNFNEIGVCIAVLTE